MLRWQAPLTLLSVVLLAILLAGLAVRDRWRRLRSLPAYALVTLSCAVLALVWPERLHVWSFWLAKESLVRVLGALVLVEMLWRVVASMPTARQVARRWLLAVGLLTGAALALVPSSSVPDAPGADPWLLLWTLEVLPRLALASAVLCLLSLGIAFHYIVPLDPLHGAVLYGFAPYLTLYALTMGSMSGIAGHALANLANGVAYILMLLLWAHAAWRREPAPDADPRVVSWVHPWR